ncbi:enoyl-CoA hydratase-related protein [Nocardia jinanensis]|uniref:Enoyl CoA dehydratase/isomerase n=1 Tax=Nocardia jinanensis TaxID=382504 RepID=A0A917RKS0_9NOCA|nr:enoyl-CoA hydratase-related protein [Nocardia jinanensis]GGL12661.1 enoyl CoA dehydratase/isomerase [Nocardia jinanensis]
MTTQPAVLVDIDGYVQTMTINRPDRRNAVNQDVRDGLRAALDNLERDPGLRAGIITAAGDAAFCAGADLHDMNSGKANSLGGADGGFAGFVRYPRSKPVIAAVNGPALGGGFEIVLACDLVVAAETAWFSLPEPTRGIIAGGGGALRLPQRLPTTVANELLLTGARLSAVKAYDWGLVNRVVAVDRVLSTARELAESICAAAPLAVSGTLAIAGAARKAAEAGAWEVNDAAVRAVRLTADAKEGPRAFAEKRAPQWSGR